VAAARTVTNPVGPAVGVQVLGLWSDWSVYPQILSSLAAAHVTWVRLDIGWVSLEQNGEGQIAPWYEARLDAFVADANSLGIHILGVVGGAPSWDRTGSGWNVFPTNPAPFGHIMGWLAARYAGKIDAWELWNEPDLMGDQGTGAAASYTALVKAAYPAVKAANPAATVVLAGTSGNNAAWLSLLYADGIHGYFDAVATHPYIAPSDAAPSTVDNGRWSLGSVVDVRALMVAHGDASKPVWFTEFGWSTGSSAGHPGVTPATQAAYLTQMLQLISANYPYVTHAFWYMARDRIDSDPHENGFGLFTTDMVAKPAFGALQAWMAAHPVATVTSTVTATVVDVAGATAGSASAAGGQLKHGFHLFRT
ncbi:MAG: cellulase family glycosylhydrolase, partial [Mycobacteriales bacterium]